MMKMVMTTMTTMTTMRARDCRLQIDCWMAFLLLFFSFLLVFFDFVCDTPFEPGVLREGVGVRGLFVWSLDGRMGRGYDIMCDETRGRGVFSAFPSPPLYCVLCCRLLTVLWKNDDTAAEAITSKTAFVSV